MENHQDYIAQLFLISTTCKSETAEQHTNLLQLARRVCDENGSLTGGHVYCLASDGEIITDLHTDPQLVTSKHNGGGSGHNLQ